MKLYEFGPTRSIRARWTLQELEVDFESIKVNLREGEHLRPEFLAVNPAGRIPVLVDGDLVISESVAIVLYLAEKYPAKQLLPTGVKQRAEMNRWLLFAVTELEQPLWRITRHTAPIQKISACPRTSLLRARSSSKWLGCSNDTCVIVASSRRIESPSPISSRHTRSTGATNFDCSTIAPDCGHT